MGLFDTKNRAVSEEHKRVSSSTQIAELERQLVEIERKRTAVLVQIGNIFVQQNSTESVKGTEYEGVLEEYSRIMREREVNEQKKLAMQGLRKCDSCGNTLSLDSLYCNKCGVRLSELLLQETENVNNVNVCSHCGTALKPNVNFCHACGSRVEKGGKSL